MARAVPGVRVIDEPEKGLVVARETARRLAQSEILVYIDADCRAPIMWLERLERRFLNARRSSAVTGPYRFYDWDWSGRTLIRALRLCWWRRRLTCSCITRSVWAPFCTAETSPSGATRIARIGGFDRRIEFHGEDTNLARRLTPVGSIEVRPECWVWTSARRYRAMGKRQVFGLYVRNFCSELLRHRPADVQHLDVRG